MLLIRTTFKLSKRTVFNSSHTNIVDDNIKFIQCYRLKQSIIIKMVILNILLLGIPQILCSLNHNIFLYLYCEQAHPTECHYVKIVSNLDEGLVIEVERYSFYSKSRYLIYDEEIEIQHNKQSKEDAYIGKEFYTCTFNYKQNKYYFNDKDEMFIAMTLDLTKYTNHEVHSYFVDGIKSISSYNYLLNKFGYNQIIMAQKSLMVIFFELIFNLQYAYQVLMIIIWLYCNLKFISISVVMVSIIIITLSSIKNSLSYKKILQFAHLEKTTIIRGFNLSQILKIHSEASCFKSKRKTQLEEEEQDLINRESKYIVPGDIIEVSADDIMSCDCLLLDGFCTVNEADLTGESSLVMKSALVKNDKNFLYSESRKCFLYHGTRIIKCESNLKDGKMRALVINTGLNTNRGNLIQNILFSKKKESNLIRENLTFFLLMLIFYIVGVGLMLKYNQQITCEPSDDNNNCGIMPQILLLLIVVMPPSLPISTSITSFYFQYNLEKKQISCVDDNKISVSGRVNTVVLDKTGTLTEEELELYGFQTTTICYRKNCQDEAEKFYLNLDEIESTANLYNMILIEFYKKLIKNDDKNVMSAYKTDFRFNMIYFLECLASCHSIDILKGNSFGNSVDKIIFENLNWHQERITSSYDSNSNIQYDVYPKDYYKITTDIIDNSNYYLFQEKKKYKLTIVKRFEFSSKFQSMSVIVKNSIDNNFRFFIKGAPEKIVQICTPSSMPDDFQEKLISLTKSGYRVLAAATKPLFEIEDFTQLNKEDDRIRFEKDLTFLGLVIFKNNLKKDTKFIINKLIQSNCQLVIATGDNPFTSISVSRESEFIKEQDKIYLFDLDRAGGVEKLSVSAINTETIDSNFLDRSSGQNVPITDRSTRKLIDRKKAFQDKVELSGGINKILVTINSSDDSVICISGKAFEFLLTKFKEEKEIRSYNYRYNKNKEEAFTYEPSKKNKEYPQQNLSMHKDKNSIIYSNDTYYSILKLISEKGKIFFRMNPNDKVLLVNFLRYEKNRIVAMCGDGANDCGALLASDIGISLCNKVGNNVTSHFYSKESSIRCIELILRNGRACYENSTIIFKYIFISSVVTVTSVVFLCSIGETFTDNHYIFFSFWISILSCFFSSKTGATYSISRLLVSSTNIMNFKFIIRLGGHSVIQILIQYCFYLVIKDLNLRSTLSYKMKYYFFILTSFQYIYMLLLFNTSSTHRKSFLSNKLYIIYTSSVALYLIMKITAEKFPFLNGSFKLFEIEQNMGNEVDFLDQSKSIITILFVSLNVVISTLWEKLANRIIN